MNGTDVAVYRPGAKTPVRTYVADTDALAWAPDSSRIFALVSSSGGYVLKTLTDPAKSVPTLTINAPATATRAKKLTVTGKVSATLPLPAGTELTVTRTDMENPGGKALPAAAVKPDGTYSFTDTPPAGARSPTRSPTPATPTVPRPPHRPGHGLPRGHLTDPEQARQPLQLRHRRLLHRAPRHHLQEPHRRDLGQPLRRRQAQQAPQEREGQLQRQHLRNRRHDPEHRRLRGLQGDARYKPKTVTSTAYARVKVATAVSKHYKTAKIGSTSYSWFHKNTDPLLTTTMGSVKRACKWGCWGY
ncbi:hypothetical protein F6456_42045 [Streptomyces sp. LBUM 1484]|nr:hypothetical protein [Streptomyces sp. LBUM 1484]